MTLLMCLISFWLPSGNVLNFIVPLVAGGMSSLGFSLYLYLGEYNAKSAIADVLGRITMHPVAAFPILVIILWIIYKLVGEFGAGTCVDFLKIRYSAVLGSIGGFDIYIYIPFIQKEYIFTHINFQGFNYYFGS